MRNKNDLTQICIEQLPLIIPKDAIPVGRPTIIQEFRKISEVSEFDGKYRDVLTNMAPPEANAFILSREKTEGYWAVQFYKTKK